MTLKTIDSFITTVDPSRATVVSFPEFIAIFGSVVSLKKRRSKPKSQRDAFYWWVLDNRNDIKEVLLFPENYNDWSDFATYSDLLKFETDLGYLTSAVLIFLESPGAIAELGAFSQIDSLSQRLIVVVTQDHHPKKSFISLGPIRSIHDTQKHPHSVCVIPAIPKISFGQIIEHIPVIVEMLDQKRQRKNDTESLVHSNHQHEILLILDLINLFLVIQITELQRLALHFGVDLKLPRLNQILFLLEKTELIISNHYGANQFYMPHKFKKIYVDYTSNTGSPPFKREKTKALVWNEIQNDSHRKHVHALANKDGGVK